MTGAFRAGLSLPAPFWPVLRMACVWPWRNQKQRLFCTGRTGLLSKTLTKHHSVSAWIYFKDNLIVVKHIPVRKLSLCRTMAAFVSMGHGLFLVSSGRLLPSLSREDIGEIQAQDEPNCVCIYYAGNKIWWWWQLFKNSTDIQQVQKGFRLRRFFLVQFFSSSLIYTQCKTMILCILLQRTNTNIAFPYVFRAFTLYTTKHQMVASPALSLCGFDATSYAHRLEDLLLFFFASPLEPS